MPQKNNDPQAIRAEDLVAEIDKLNRENKEFLDAIDKRIALADLAYLKSLIEEKKDYIKLAKKIHETDA